MNGEVDEGLLQGLVEENPNILEEYQQAGYEEDQLALMTKIQVISELLGQYQNVSGYQAYLESIQTQYEQMKDSSFFIWKTGEKRNGISGRWYIEDDGTCVYQPKGLSWFYGTGEVALTLSEEASCTAVFTIEERSFLYWIPIGFVLFSLFLLWCIIGWIRQPKFNNQIMEIVVYTKFGSAIQESPRIKVMKRRIGLIPYRACRMRVGDLVFIAAPGRKIVLDKDCVRGRVVYSGKVRFMGRSAGNMKRLLRMMEPAKRDVRMVRGMELYVAPDKNAQALTGYRITG